MIQSMVFWWFPSVFSKNHPQTGFPKSSKNHRLNHQKIIDFWIFQSFCNMFNENQGKIPKSMIFWWFNRWFFDDFPQFFRKIIPRPVSPNHQKIIDWIIKKSSGFQQFPGMLPKIIKKSSFESSSPRKVTWNHPRKHHFLNMSQKGYPKSS